MQEIINDFVVESNELLERAIQDMVEVEANADDEKINSVFRAIHTVKGTSSFLGFNVLSELAHKAEDVLGRIRKGELSPDGEIADTLLKAMDVMKLLVEDIRSRGKEEQDTLGLITMLDTIYKMEQGKRLGEILVEEEVLTKKELEDILKKQKEEQGKRLGEIVLEERLVTENQLNNLLTKQKALKTEQTVRIDVKKLDELMNLVGELVLGKNRLTMVNGLVKKGLEAETVLENLEEITNYIEVVTNDLQLSIMKTRLVPLSKLFNKIPRMLRDLCNEFKKEIQLTMEGEATELDRSLIESLYDPLVHIIRNSVDHGIETPEERERLGKARKGILSIKAYNEGNHVIIEVFDDGKGIDVQAIKDKVKEKGLMTENELMGISDKDAMNLVFIPGLSTAKKVTSVSGRGVGMDVVRTNIEKMNGQVYIDSEYGKWTRLTIKLPLTLAIMKALIVGVKDELFAIPLNNVIELVKLEQNLIKSVEKAEVLMLRDTIISHLWTSQNSSIGMQV
jgi:two-component system chemotaxis sensor kinase CheA